MPESLVIGVLTACTMCTATVVWYLWVRPDALLSWLHQDGAEVWFEEHPALLRALRLTAGLALFLMGFLTGAATSFLSGTR